MKKLLLTSALAFSAILYANAQSKDLESENVPEIQFEVESHDFGTIKEGEMASFEFKFKNTGKAPLIVSKADPSCGCTIPDWTREPVNPGQSGKVSAVYNSNGRPGTFHKSITVNSNAKTPVKILTIKGNVIPKPVVPESPVLTKPN